MTRAEQIRIAALAIDDALLSDRAAARVVDQLAESPTQRVARLFGEAPWKVARVGHQAPAMERYADRLRHAHPSWRVRVRRDLEERDGTRWIAVEVLVEEVTSCAS